MTIASTISLAQQVKQLQQPTQQMIITMLQLKHSQPSKQ